MSKAIFVGRFQPFHLGHLSVLEDIENNQEVNEIIIGIGSSQYSETDDNPYTFETRKKMIEMAIKNKIIKPCHIIAVPDIHDDERWVGHVEKITGDFDLVYSGNPHTTELFEKAGYEVRPVIFQHDISGTKLRKMIKKNNAEWKKFIPQCNLRLI